MGHFTTKLGPVAQSVVSPIADPGVVSSILAWSHTFVEIDHTIFSMDILFLLLIQELLMIQELLIWLQAKGCAHSTGQPLSQACTGKSVVRLTERLDMTTAVDWNVKPQTTTKNLQLSLKSGSFQCTSSVELLRYMYYAVYS